MTDDTERLPVYACTVDEAKDEQPIGMARDRREAARMIRKHIAETTGDADTGITAEFVRWSRSLNAYVLDQ